MKSIGCEVYQVADKIKEYRELGNDDKIKLIIKNSIDIANENLKDKSWSSNILYRYSDDFVTEFLDDGISFDDYSAHTEELADDIHYFLKSISKDPLNQQLAKELKCLSNMFSDDLASEIAKQQIGIPIDMFFTSVFGYYLGIIMPVYENFFIINPIANLIVSSPELLQAQGFVYKLSLGHDLTSLGRVVIKDVKKDFREKGFNTMDLRSVKDVVKKYKEDKAIILKDVKEMDLLSDIINNNDKFDILSSLTSEEVGSDINMQDF